MIGKFNNSNTFYESISCVISNSNRFTPSNTEKKEESIVESAKEQQPIQPEKPKEVQKVVRTKSVWVPCQLLCYKMNIEAVSR